VELGFRELSYLAGILVSISGAFYVARFQIKSLVILVSKHDKRLVSLDHRQDDAESARAVIDSKLKILAQINSVEQLEKNHRELAAISANIQMLEREVGHLRTMHNTKHPSL
jgi:hypothetical protein